MKKRTAFQRFGLAVKWQTAKNSTGLPNSAILNGTASSCPPDKLSVGSFSTWGARGGSQGGRGLDAKHADSLSSRFGRPSRNPFCGYPGIYRRMFRSRLKSGISLAEKSMNW